jgi:hypothetical protein
VGLFDTYIPSSEIRCPVCDRVLRVWQGKDGPCALLSFVQGERADLPPEFVICSDDCACQFGVDAVCACEYGVWSKMEVVCDANFDRLYWHLPKASRAARRKWLASGKRS